MDAEAWEMAVPSMGVLALVRNLANFDQAGISEAAVDTVIAKVTDPSEVARARLFPYQVWAAYKRAVGQLGTGAGQHPRLDPRQHPGAGRHSGRHRHVRLHARPRCRGARRWHGSKWPQ